MEAQQTSNNPDPHATPAVLVVEDDAGMRTILLKILRANGFHCFGAADHQDMDRRLARGGIDLILLDVMLPGRNGFDICRDLRARSERNIPVIMISARGSEATASPGWNLARTTTSPSPSARASCWRGSGRCCGAAG